MTIFSKWGISGISETVTISCGLATHGTPKVTTMEVLY